MTARDCLDELKLWALTRRVSVGKRAHRPLFSVLYVIYLQHHVGPHARVKVR